MYVVSGLIFSRIVRYYNIFPQPYPSRLQCEIRIRILYVPTIRLNFKTGQ